MTSSSFIIYPHPYYKKDHQEDIGLLKSQGVYNPAPSIIMFVEKLDNWW